MANNLSGVDIRDLEGRKGSENRPAVQSRDFFWDSLTLFVVGAILALSAIDFLFEWIRGSQVQCFFNQSSVRSQSLGNVGDYINERCATNLPPAEYLPAFIAIHSLVVLAPHYIWLNIYGAKLDSFFHLASSLFRSKDPDTGDYPDNNYVISKQCTSHHYSSNWMFVMYLVKLGLQILLSVGGLCLVARSFKDFDETFPCPRDDNATEGDDWPLVGENAQCVFTSLRLLHKVWITYFILISVAIIFLLLAFVWLVAAHPDELGCDKVVKFSFETSLPFHHYKHPILFLSSSRLPPVIYQFLCLFPTFSYWSNKFNHICSDYDFLLVKLFRTDSSLAQVLREVQMQRMLKDENNLEVARQQALREVHIQQLQEDEDELEVASLKSHSVEWITQQDKGIGWKDFDLVTKHKPVNVETPLLLPPTIRGVVVGHAARCIGSMITPRPRLLHDKILCGALVIVFDSESVGFAGALAGAFQRVAVLNFSSSYSNYENPVCINANDAHNIIVMTVPHDIIMKHHIVETKLDTENMTIKYIIINDAATRFYNEFVDEIWKPGYLIYNRKDQIADAKRENQTADANKEEEEEVGRKAPQYMTDYIVVGPVYTDMQQAIVNMFLKRKCDYISKDAVLLTLQPRQLGGVGVSAKEFSPRGFKSLKHKAGLLNIELKEDASKSVYNWPQTLPNTTEIKNLKTEMGDENVWTIMTGNTHSTFHFKLYTRDSSCLLQSDKAITMLASPTESPTTHQSHVSVLLDSSVSPELSGTTDDQIDTKQEDQTKAKDVKGQSDTSIN